MLNKVFVGNPDAYAALLPTKSEQVDRRVASVLGGDPTPEMRTRARLAVTEFLRLQGPAKR
jgi:hypothetical protein